MAADRPIPVPLDRNRIVTDPVRSVMVSLTLPILMEQMLSTLVGLVDTFLAGNLENHAVEATSAVGLASYVGWLVTMLFALVGTGTTALVARAYGSNEREYGNRVANQSLLLAVFMGAFGVVAMYFLAPRFASWQSMRGITYDITVRYLRIESLSYIGMAITLVGGAAIRGAGDTRTPMKVLASVNVFNGILSYGLVHGIGPLPKMDVDGIVMGTLISRLLGGLILMIVILVGARGIRIRMTLLRPAIDVIRRITRIGIPAAVDGVIMWTGHFMFLKIIGSMASEVASGLNPSYAAQIVVVRLEAFTYLPASAYAAACATMIGQALGANMPKRAIRSGHEGAMQCCMLTAISGTLFVIFARQICGLMHKDPAVIDIATPVLVIAGLAQPVLALCMVYAGALRGAGDTVYPLIYNVCGIGLIRLPFGYLFGLYMGWGLFGAWIAVAADMVARMLMMAIRFRRGKWVTLQV